MEETRKRLGRTGTEQRKNVWKKPKKKLGWNLRNEFGRKCEGTAWKKFKGSGNFISSFLPVASSSTPNFFQ